ncbi:MAG: hypothetical protein O7C75_11065 [Verrucomicrobia bacterium]|nr:hypothetical protein [Verrucomicrobiota bacterium]
MGRNFQLTTRIPMGLAWALLFAVVPLGYGFTPVNMESGVEWVDADDISLLQVSWGEDFETGTWESSVSLAFGHYGMDYQPVPFDFQGEETRRSERNLSLQFNTRNQVNNHTWIIAGAGVYDGYTNYRSVWLDEYYRQQYSELFGFPGAENYVEADPKGINGTAGVRWSYLSGSGFAELNVSRLRDDVSPGYEIDFDGLRRGELTLATAAISLSTENVLSKRVRSFFEVRASKTTARSTRYGAEFALNVAMGENWVSRWNVGGATEDPQFDAYYGGVALEYQANDNLSWFVDARYYEDTGEIENALLFTSAAPGLISNRFGIGLRWIGDSWSSRLYVAPLDTNYEPTRESTDFFQNLYLDRDWTVFQFAVGRSL